MQKSQKQEFALNVFPYWLNILLLGYMLFMNPGTSSIPNGSREPFKFMNCGSDGVIVVGSMLLLAAMPFRHVATGFFNCSLFTFVCHFAVTFWLFSWLVFAAYGVAQSLSLSESLATDATRNMSYYYLLLLPSCHPTSLSESVQTYPPLAPIFQFTAA